MMTRILSIATILLSGSASFADTVVAARTIRSHEILTGGDLVVQEGDVPGAISDPASAVGLEARVVLYAGRPIRPADIGPAATVDRNQIIALRYTNDGLSITTEGRALDRAGPGDTVRVMNLSSRTTVTGRVMPDGSVIVTH